MVQLTLGTCQSCPSHPITVAAAVLNQLCIRRDIDRHKSWDLSAAFTAFLRLLSSISVVCAMPSEPVSAFPVSFHFGACPYSGFHPGSHVAPLSCVLGLLVTASPIPFFLWSWKPWRALVRFCKLVLQEFTWHLPTRKTQGRGLEKKITEVKCHSYTSVKCVSCPHD